MWRSCASTPLVKLVRPFPSACTAQEPFALILRHYSSQEDKKPSLTQRYERFLEAKLPRAYAVHRMVVDGCKWCWSDLKTYYRLSRDLRNGNRSLSDLTRQELEVFIQTREELPKLVTIIVIAPLPLTVYIIAFAIIFFPRYVLTRHFWSDKQRHKFWSHATEKAIQRHYPPVLEYFKDQQLSFPVPFNELAKVRVEPLEDLRMGHLFHLFRTHKVSLWSGTRGLRKRAELLHQLDARLQQNSQVIAQMSHRDLYTQLHLRRLRFEGLSDDQMREKLRQWLMHSNAFAVDPSLYLHVPVLSEAKSNPCS